MHRTQFGLKILLWLTAVVSFYMLALRPPMELSALRRFGVIALACGLVAWGILIVRRP
ncbi:MAG TPA: hypothetical protein VHC22_18485 [Pirellulales bacterium]|nr:hypothetical protein [Pirellulales bacterium]